MDEEQDVDELGRLSNPYRVEADRARSTSRGARAATTAAVVVAAVPLSGSAAWADEFGDLGDFAFGTSSGLELAGGSGTAGGGGEFSFTPAAGELDLDEVASLFESPATPSQTLAVTPSQTPAVTPPDTPAVTPPETATATPPETPAVTTVDPAAETPTGQVGGAPTAGTTSSTGDPVLPPVQITGDNPTGDITPHPDQAPLVANMDPALLDKLFSTTYELDPANPQQVACVIADVACTLRDLSMQSAPLTAGQAQEIYEDQPELQQEALANSAGFLQPPEIACTLVINTDGTACTTGVLTVGSKASVPSGAHTPDSLAAAGVDLDCAAAVVLCHTHPVPTQFQGEPLMWPVGGLSSGDIAVMDKNGEALAARSSDAASVICSVSLLEEVITTAQRNCDGELEVQVIPGRTGIVGRTSVDANHSEITYPLAGPDQAVLVPTGENTLQARSYVDPGSSALPDGSSPLEFVEGKGLAESEAATMDRYVQATRDMYDPEARSRLAAEVEAHDDFMDQLPDDDADLLDVAPPAASGDTTTGDAPPDGGRGGTVVAPTLDPEATAHLGPNEGQLLSADDATLPQPGGGTPVDLGDATPPAPDDATLPDPAGFPKSDPQLAEDLATVFTNPVSPEVYEPGPGTPGSSDAQTLQLVDGGPALTLEKDVPVTVPDGAGEVTITYLGEQTPGATPPAGTGASGSAGDVLNGLVQGAEGVVGAVGGVVQDQLRQPLTVSNAEDGNLRATFTGGATAVYTPAGQRVSGDEGTPQQVAPAALATDPATVGDAVGGLVDGLSQLAAPVLDPEGTATGAGAFGLTP